MKSVSRVLLVALLMIGLGGLLAWSVQTDGGQIKIKDIRFVGTNGTVMSALLYVPKNATVKTPAPGVLAVHGYINTRETQDGFAIEFARRGYYGTPTTDVARGAGISQAYLFRLFPTKEELFVACVERTYRTVHDEFVKVSAPHAGDQEAVMTAMGDRYNELLQSSDVLLCQLHGYAACQEPAIRVAVRDGYRELVELVQHLSGAADEEIQRFLSLIHISEPTRPY